MDIAVGREEDCVAEVEAEENENESDERNEESDYDSEEDVLLCDLVKDSGKK